MSDKTYRCPTCGNTGWWNSPESLETRAANAANLFSRRMKLMALLYAAFAGLLVILGLLAPMFVAVTVLCLGAVATFIGFVRYVVNTWDVLDAKNFTENR